jgi:hypothetical protein
LTNFTGGGVPGAATVSDALASRIRRLDHSQTLTIAEFAAPGLVRWEVRRGEDGIARPWYWPPILWERLSHGGLPAADEVLRAASSPGGDTLTICTAPGHPAPVRAVTMVDAANGTTAGGAGRSLIADADLGEALADVLRHDPLTLPYELLVQRRVGGGYLDNLTILLFPRGARRGDREDITLLCERSDAGGTVFAVVARDDLLAYQLVSKQSAAIPPGTYEVTAELVQPGRVRFTGLPVDLHDDTRDWGEIARSVPGQLARTHPAHLIVAIESSGEEPDVRERIGRAEQLVRCVSSRPGGQARFSLLCYGPHAVHRTDLDVPVTSLVWGEGAADVLKSLGWLAEQAPAPIGYPAAAQIECMLAEVTARLGAPGDRQDRPVLVTIGARPAFPSQVNSSRVIPCRKHDWRTELLRLQRYQGIAFGAIRDRGPGAGHISGRGKPGGPAEEVWLRLGATIFAWLDAVDVPGFATALGLASSPHPPMPLPFEATGGVRP